MHVCLGEGETLHGGEMRSGSTDGDGSVKFRGSVSESFPPRPHPTVSVLFSSPNTVLRGLGGAEWIHG